MSRRLVGGPRAELRLQAVDEWLAARPHGEETVVVGASSEAATECVRRLAQQRGSAFGVHALSWSRLAGELAKLGLAERGLAPVGALPLEALCARVVDRLRGTFGRLAAVAQQPGLPRALARTLGELRMAGATAVADDPDLTAALVALDEELAAHGLADRALVFEAAATNAAQHPLHGTHVALVDVPIHTVLDERLVAAIVRAAPSVLATVPAGDGRTEARLARVLGVDLERLATTDGAALRRVQHHLFGHSPPQADLDDTVRILSAPGENRECVELARRVLHQAERGTPFDRMAVLLRSPEQYRVHLEEALARANIPAHFAQGTRLPHPSGRAFLALLACAGEGLSARRFAEYLSLSELPEVKAAPPAETPAVDRWVPPDEELVPRALVAEGDDAPPAAEAAPSLDHAVAAGTLRAPARWERVLVEAAVIGGRERWARRLDGYEARLRLLDGEDMRESRERELRDIGHLREFALPLLDDLAALPAQAAWSTWLDRLAALATRALRHPERVLAALSELNPMSAIGPVVLREVRDVLHERLTELVERPSGRRYGKLFVAPIEAARGMAFDVVFVPGLAERMFPQKLVEDPLLLDERRSALGLELETRDDRLAHERLALHIAVGAARDRLVVSYPRIDLEQGRPRVPSFYGLELLQAGAGSLPGFEDLARSADNASAARIGWPAPGKPTDAIDEAEHDLALLDRFIHAATPANAPKGVARYLMDANVHLARALRTRARRWEIRTWKPTDGLVVTTAAAREALAEHGLARRSFSPTALEQLAACPYRFALRTILRLEPREAPEPIESIGALERGSLVHEVQFELLRDLAATGSLPVRAATLDAARTQLDAVLSRVAARFHDQLAPAIEGVWNDGIDAVRADLREWLRRMVEDEAWTPRRFELAFGLAGREARDKRDGASVDEPLALDVGLILRGSIDLVEEGPGGMLRATDHKTGKQRVARGALIDGGRSLQPILYALALEKLTGKEVVGGRLYYCTTRGDFQKVDVDLDARARAAAKLVVATLQHHLEQAFFPAAPAPDECKYCDYRPVCGPYEEARLKKKSDGKLRLKQLDELRRHA